MKKETFYIKHCYSSTKGGKTILMKLGEDNVLRASVANCHPKDRYVKKIGVKVAKELFESGKYVLEVKVPDGVEISNDQADTLMVEINYAKSRPGASREKPLSVNFIVEIDFRSL